MTRNQIYNKLFSGGNYSKQYLIDLVHPTAGTLHYVNNNEDVVYNGITYTKANFSYTPPKQNGEGASLEISGIDNAQLFEWVEESDDNYELNVVGILNDEEVSPIHNYKHFHGTISVGEDNKIAFSLENDGRLDMVFTVYKYDTDSNRGNS